jgi:hypothetical protein
LTAVPFTTGLVIQNREAGSDDPVRLIFDVWIRLLRTTAGTGGPYIGRSFLLRLGISRPHERRYGVL